jgi:hypothetical protein
MKFLLNALLAAAVPATMASDLFTKNLMSEYMWCCSDANCWSACAYLCEEKDKPNYCVGGAMHPGSQISNGDGDEVTTTDLVELMRIWYTNHPEVEAPDWVVNHEDPPEVGTILPPKTGNVKGDTPPDDFFRDRALQVNTGCGPPPAGIPDLKNPVFAEWYYCYLDFFFGNEFSKRHCENTLPIGKCCEGPCSGGEPHFKTWVGEWYDYHGEW